MARSREMTRKKLKAFLIGLCCGAMPLVTQATCDPRFGTFDFFRDDDSDDSFLDIFVDDPYYYDDCYYDDCYYDDVIIYD